MNLTAWPVPCNLIGAANIPALRQKRWRNGPDVFSPLPPFPVRTHYVIRAKYVWLARLHERHETAHSQVAHSLPGLSKLHTQ